MSKNPSIPTQLFIGPQEILQEKTEQILQQIFCKNNISSCFCTQCRKIKNNQHELIVKICPEKDYSVKDLDIIFQKTNLALNDGQKFFFILEKAQTLGTICANRLLKVLEEPPTEYHFILHTNNINSILPTIISRCHILDFSTNEIDSNSFHPLLKFFYFQDLNNPAEFEKELKKLELSDSDSIELFNNMLSFYAQKIKSGYKNQDPKELQKAYDIYHFLIEKMHKPPQSGSSNIFWKNLYISFPKT